MDNRLQILLLVVCVFSTIPAMGKVVSAEQALEYSLIELASATRSNADPSHMRLVGQRECNGIAALYIFSSPSMYMIASGNDNFPGLLAYSLDGGFSAAMSPEMEWWLDQCSQYIGTADGSLKPVNKGNRSPVAPMISARWDQCAPYNNLIPQHNGNTPYTGCVATAMAQIMSYHEWPDRGMGETQWTCGRDYASHDHVFNFEDTPFDWESMAD